MNTFVWFCLKVTGASESVFGIFQADQAQIIDRISHKLFFEALVRDYWQDSECKKKNQKKSDVFCKTI